MSERNETSTTNTDFDLLRAIRRARAATRAHAEHTKTARLSSPCTAHDMTYGGRCLNCGFDPAKREGAK